MRNKILDWFDSFELFALLAFLFMLGAFILVCKGAR